MAKKDLNGSRELRIKRAELPSARQLAWAYAHLFVYVCIHIMHVCLYTCVCLCMDVYDACVHMLMHVCMCVCVCVYMLTYVYVCVVCVGRLAFVYVSGSPAPCRWEVPLRSASVFVSLGLGTGVKGGMGLREGTWVAAVCRYGAACPAVSGEAKAWLCLECPQEGQAAGPREVSQVCLH